MLKIGKCCPILCAKKLKKWRIFAGFRRFLGLKTDDFYAKQPYSVVLDA